MCWRPRCSRFIFLVGFELSYVYCGVVVTRCCVLCLGSRSCGSYRSRWRYEVSRRPSACLPPERCERILQRGGHRALTSLKTHMTLFLFGVILGAWSPGVSTNFSVSSRITRSAPCASRFPRTVLWFREIVSLFFFEFMLEHYYVYNLLVVFQGGVEGGLLVGAHLHRALLPTSWLCISCGFHRCRSCLCCIPSSWCRETQLLCQRTQLSCQKTQFWCRRAQPPCERT